MSRANLIRQVRQLISPAPSDTRPEAIAFRESDRPGVWRYQGQELTREQCRRVPAKMLIFVRHRAGADRDTAHVLLNQ